MWTYGPAEAVPGRQPSSTSPTRSMVSAYAKPRRGWERLYVQTVQQANMGVDLDFLVGSAGHSVSRESH